MGDEYLLANRKRQAGERFEALSALFDGWTFRRMTELGIGPGWRCWEVGAGGANVPNWLAERVGTMGQVIATDIDTAWAERGIEGNIEVRTQDVADDDPPSRGFDLVHARLVLVHVPARDQALRRMVDNLRPGGWLLIEDADPALQPLACPDAQSPAELLANKVRDGFRTLMVHRGVDLAYGRKLPRLLRIAGLSDVMAEGFFPLGGPVCARLERATVEMLRTELVAAGLASADEIDDHLSNITNGRLDLTTAPMISAWGRKP